MRIFFWQYCDVNECAREWTFCIITLFVFIFTVYSIVNTYKYYKRFIFELLPLSFNCIATALLLSLQIFEKGFQYHLATYLIEIYTYFLFCYTFTTMFLRVKNVQNLNQLKKIINIVFVIFSLMILALLIIVFIKTISPSCESVFTISFYVFFVIQGMLYAFTLYFGLQIIKQMKITQELQIKLMKPTASFQESLLEDRYIRQRRKQILIILSSYTITMFLRLVSIILNNIFSEKIHCTYIDEAYIRGADDSLGQTLIVLNSLVELVPHILLPIAMYIIPSVNKKSILVINDDQSLNNIGDMQAEDMDFTNENIMRQKFSSLITSTLSSKNQSSESNQI